MSSPGVTKNCEECGGPSPVQGEVRMVNVGYAWTIDNCSTLLRESSASSAAASQHVVALKSPVFSLEPGSALKWQLQLHSDIERAHASLYLELMKGPDSVDTQFKFAISDQVDDQLYKWISGAHVFVKGNTTASINLATHEELEELFLENSTLTVLCLVRIEKSKKEEVGPKEDEQLKVADDIKRLLNCPAFSDIKFLVFGKEFYAHKCVLAARCPDFISSLMCRLGNEDYGKAKYNPPQQLTDVDPEIMLEILRFLYCGKVNGFEDNAFKLLCASRRYSVDPLHTICEDYLCKHVTADTAAYFFTYAPRFSADKLAKAALNYIVAHRKEVLKTKGYKDMAERFPELLDKIYQAAALGESRSPTGLDTVSDLGEDLPIVNNEE